MTDHPTIGERAQSLRLGLRKRELMAGAAISLLISLPDAAACAAGSSNINVTAWDLPRLSFTMNDADTGKEVRAQDFHGKVVLLYFGYTSCPDVCPLTLHNIALILGRLGRQARDVQVLFVTVDPYRDTLAVLRRYTHLFAPEIVGLRGTADQLASLARKYHIGYSVSPATASHPYEVTHSSAIYAFDAHRRARLLIPSLASTTPDISGTATDLEQLLRADRGGALAALGRLL